MWGDWRDAYVHGTLVIWPPDEVRAVVNPLRERYDRESSAVCETHITLTQPFVRALNDDDLDTVAATIYGFEPFEISYGGIGTFLPYPCLFLTIEPVDRLTAIHEALQATGLFLPVPQHHERFVPHMTILENSLTADATAKLAEQLRDTAPAGSYLCRDVALVVPDATFHFSVARRFALGPRTA